MMNFETPQIINMSKICFNNLIFTGSIAAPSKILIIDFNNLSAIWTNIIVIASTIYWVTLECSALCFEAHALWDMRVESIYYYL